MKTIQTAEELAAGSQKVCLAVGFFDGVHLGHQQIIRQTIADARQHEAIALVLTFDRHPNTIVAPARVPPLIYSLTQKLRVMESLGTDVLLLIRFDQAFSEQTGEAFVRSLVKDLPRIQSLCVGADFTFGHQRSGNVALLNRLGKELGFAVHGMAAVSLDDKIISSTRIREEIRAGDFDRVSQMLGRAYSLAGPVVKGDRLGHQLGFPTANLDVTGLVLPPKGVYMAHVFVRGETRRAVVNIGVRPTLPNSEPPVRVEVHLLDFDADLYGSELEIAFSDKLRDERKFASVEELKKQIARDVEEAIQRF